MVTTKEVIDTLTEKQKKRFILSGWNNFGNWKISI